MSERKSKASSAEPANELAGCAIEQTDKQVSQFSALLRQSGEGQVGKENLIVRDPGTGYQIVLIPSGGQASKHFYAARARERSDHANEPVDKRSQAARGFSGGRGSGKRRSGRMMRRRRRRRKRRRRKRRKKEGELGKRFRSGPSSLPEIGFTTPV